MSSSGRHESRLRRSIPAALLVWAVAAWYLSSLAVTIVMSHNGTVVKLQRTTLSVAWPIAVALATALAYILVVRRSPSGGRWVWAGFVVFTMVAAAITSLLSPQAGQHAYTNHDTLSTAIISLVVIGPLVWFYKRPAKAKSNA